MIRITAVMVRIKNGEIIMGDSEQTALCIGYIAPFEQHCLASYGYRPKPYHALGSTNSHIGIVMLSVHET